MLKILLKYFILPLQVTLCQPPFIYDTNCFINYVFGNDSTLYEIPNTPQSSQFVTFTVHHYEKLNYDITLEDIVRTNLTMLDGYFRFWGKFWNSCIVFILLTSTFEEALTSVEKSGFSSSNYALFFVKVYQIHSNNSIIYSFTNNLFLSETEPFHAGVIFFEQNSALSRVALHCYFCNEKLTISNNLSLSHLQSLSEKLNSLGYDRKLPIRSSPMNSWEPQCMIKPGQKNDRRVIHEALRKCASRDLVVVISLQSYVNLTFISQMPSTEDLNELNWFLKLVPGEAALSAVPNEFAFTRGAHYLIDQNPVHLMACVKMHSLTSFDFTFGSIFNLPVVIIVFLVMFPYVLIYQNIRKGADTIWPLFGLCMSLKHPPLKISVTLLGMCLFYCVFSARICTDCLRIAKFPTIYDLFKKGYKILMPPNQFANIKAILNLPLVKILAFSLVRNMNAGTTMESLMLQSKVPVGTLISLVDDMSYRKLFITPGINFDLFILLQGKDKFIGKKFMCHAFDLNVDIPLQGSLPVGARIWGYMSKRMTWVFAKGLEMGLFSNAKSWKLSQSQKTMNSIKATDAGTFVEPGPASILQSPVGISSIYLFTIGCSLLTLFLVYRRDVILTSATNSFVRMPVIKEFWNNDVFPLN